MAAGLSREAAHSQLSSAVDVVIHLGRGADGRRRVREIGVVTRARDGTVEVVSGVELDRGRSPSRTCARPAHGAGGAVTPVAVLTALLAGSAAAMWSGNPAGSTHPHAGPRPLRPAACSSWEWWRRD